MTAFVLGNGISRRAISRDQLQGRGSIYACNLAFEEGPVDVLVATDRPIADWIQDQGYSRDHRFYTRRPRPDTGAHEVPQQYRGFSSGPIAVALACLDHADPVYLLGFDLGPDQQGRFNNIFAGREFYRAPGSSPTYTGNWCRQLVQIMADFSRVRFVRVYGAETAAIAELDRVRNLAHINQDQFLDLINKPKG